MEAIYNLYLISQIHLKRKEMYSLAKVYGLSDSRVIICSQYLDKLLNQYDEKNYNSNMKNGNMRSEV